MANGESEVLARILAERGDDRITSGVIRRALEAGDPVTRQVLADAEEVLALLISSVVNLLDPECIVLGGGCCILANACMGQSHCKVGRDAT